MVMGHLLTAVNSLSRCQGQARALHSGDGALFDALSPPDAVSNFSGAPLTGEEQTLSGR
ncbi:hypothetical protein GCM10010428_52240 [Actinosynnema pretiosum subsp. pretiosum]